MNEEVSRILELLENGTITAEEAERLIRAAGSATAQTFAQESATAVPPMLGSAKGAAEEEANRHSDRAVEDFWDPFSPFANPLPDIGDLSKALRRLRDRIRRHNTRRFWWNYFRLNRWYERRRSQRRASMSVYERVRFVLLGAPAWSDFILQPQTDIHELLERDRIAWDLFRFGLEEEFGIEVSIEQVHSFRTVENVVDYIEQVQPPGPIETEPEPESEPRTESATELVVESAGPGPGRTGRAKSGRGKGAGDISGPESPIIGETPPESSPDSSGLPPVE